MSILGIIGICFAITSIIILLAILVICLINEEYLCNIKTVLILIISYSVLFIASILIGIGINTENEKIYVKKYLAQKETIEASLEVEKLSGLERIELVKQATELNGELAERKARFELWYFVVYDNTIYDNVELIKLKK